MGSARAHLKLRRSAKTPFGIQSCAGGLANLLDQVTKVVVTSKGDRAESVPAAWHLSASLFAIRDELCLCLAEGLGRRLGTL